MKLTTDNKSHEQEEPAHAAHEHEKSVDKSHEQEEPTHSADEPEEFVEKSHE